MSDSKLMPASDAVRLVHDGAVLGVGGVMEQMVPVTFLLALAEHGTANLHCITVAAGLAIDLPVGAGCADEVSCAIVSFEDLGTSKVFRRRVEAGELEFHEHTELTMITRLNAAVSGLPYLPTRAALGTDIARREPGAMRLVECPFTGAPLLACAALRPDVSVIHVDRADELGNAQLSRKHIWHDAMIARAAQTLIVTAEEIVDSQEVRRTPDMTFLPAFAVDAVVAAPGGARPTSCPGRYDADHDVLREWLSASADDKAMRALVDRWISARSLAAEAGA